MGYALDLGVDYKTLATSLKQNKPRIHCLTNSVAQTLTANCLLACGVSPSMTSSQEEIADFVKKSNGLLINLGMLSSERKASIRIAIDTANEHNIPWALDPVKVHLSPKREDFAKEILEKKPALIRANEAEADIFFGTGQTQNIITIITGKTDTVLGQKSTYKISNGHPYMSQTTAIGCALTPYLLAFLITNTQQDKQEETAALALAAYGLAGERAAKDANGPGTFVAAFVDSLAALKNLDHENDIKLQKVETRQ